MTNSTDKFVKNVKTAWKNATRRGKYLNIMELPYAEKVKHYLKIGKKAKGVSVKEHKSGFPAVTVDYKNIHLLTDILSLEKWFAVKNPTGKWVKNVKTAWRNATKRLGHTSTDCGMCLGEGFVLEGKDEDEKVECPECGGTGRVYGHYYPMFRKSPRKAKNPFLWHTRFKNRVKKMSGPELRGLITSAHNDLKEAEGRLTEFLMYAQYPDEEDIKAMSSDKRAEYKELKMGVSEERARFDILIAERNRRAGIMPRRYHRSASKRSKVKNPVNIKYVGMPASFWIVTIPEMGDSIEDICFETSIEGVMFQGLGGLKSQSIVAICKRGSDAKRIANKLLGQFSKQIRI